MLSRVTEGISEWRKKKSQIDAEWRKKNEFLGAHG
jgi:hypothetical protein